MYSVVFFIFFIINTFADPTKNAKIEYYAKIIQETRQQTTNYEFPTYNSEFQTGYESSETFDYGSFDFIIIGAGSSGAVLTKRLSEIRRWSVLLLEAGGEETDFSQIPALSSLLQLTDMNWGYLTVPQNNSCLGMREQRCVSPRGKVLGGTSSINSVMYVRGNAADYDGWAKATNSSIWTYRNVLPYFKKSENCHIDGDVKYHGKGGLLDINYGKPVYQTGDDFLLANAELHQTRVDYNGREQIGCARTQFTTRFGSRLSTNRAFLNKARYQDNVNVTIKALATKIIINDKNIAVGVEFIKDDKIYVATAIKEVIVSGGAINSPQLLMLSGIGPKAHLEKMGIKVVADLPVGQNLVEHPQFHGLVFKTNCTVDRGTVEDQIREYIDGKGIFTYGTQVEGLGFIPTSKSTNPSVPIIEYLYIVSAGQGQSYSKFVNLNDIIIEGFVNNIKSSNILLYINLLHEKSRGSVTLKSNNPLDFPNIDFNMLSDENNEDVANMIEGIKFILKLTQTETFQKINATLIDYPVCKEFIKFTNEYWECALRHLTTTLYHPSGTTQMGTNSSNSVVDVYLKVHGVEKLRVVDAGVIPNTFSGHTNAPAIMIAEKIADIIKAEHAKCLCL